MQLRLTLGVFSNANDITLFLMTQCITLNKPPLQASFSLIPGIQIGSIVTECLNPNNCIFVP